ncbi:hypothetical protein ACM66B_004321 [Microbotryomycetes sp. NB124-2]
MQSPRRSKPAEYAAKAFEPETIDVPAVTVAGPLISTSSDAPSTAPIDGQSAPAARASSSSNASSSEPSRVVNVDIDPQSAQEATDWANERIEKRLRADYERSGRLLSELVTDNLDTKLNLHAVRVIGAKSTRPDFLAGLVRPALALANDHRDKGHSLGSLLRTTRDLSNRFAQFDIFRNIQAGLEASSSVLAGPDDVDIVMRVQEAPKYFVRTATDVGDGEGNATGTVKIRNALGGAETVEGNVSFGTRTKNAFQLRFDTPVNASATTHADVSVFSAHRDLNYFAGCFERTRGAQARVRTLSQWGWHEITYDAVLRQIGEVSPRASLSIRDEAGSNVKSAVAHTLTRDTRDDPIAATKGVLLRARQEYAGLGGDVNFAKAENEFSWSTLLGPGTSLSLTAKAGALLPLGGQASSFVDRFHLGGPTSVRMFRPNAMGPRDNNDFTGGDLCWALGASVLAPFPRKPDWPLKLHAFVNAGRLVRWSPGDASLHDTTASLVRHPSLTAGVGLMYRHSLVRVEANVGIPIAATAGEGTVKGLQFGLGLSFL